MRSISPILHKVILCIFFAISAHVFAGEHIIATKFGDVKVNDEVKRVIALNVTSVDTAVAVGVYPVATATSRGTDGVSSYMKGRIKDVEVVGSLRQINIEAILKLKPDLILASSRLPEEQYELLSKVAPTIAPVSQKMSRGNWMDETLVYADALGHKAAGEAAIAQVRQRAEKMRKQVLQLLSDEQRSATVARWMPNGALVMSPEIFSSGVLASAGFDVNGAGVVKEGRPHSSPLSLENLPNIDSEWLFLATINKEARDALVVAQKSPAFARLSVVKKDHVISVDGQLWTDASGPIAANMILDDIQKMLDDKVLNN